MWTVLTGSHLSCTVVLAGIRRSQKSWQKPNMTQQAGKIGEQVPCPLVATKLRYNIYIFYQANYYTNFALNILI